MLCGSGVRLMNQAIHKQLQGTEKLPDQLLDMPVALMTNTEGMKCPHQWGMNCPALQTVYIAQVPKGLIRAVSNG